MGQHAEAADQHGLATSSIASLPPIRQGPQAPARTADAESWKEQGNEHFKAGEFSKAVAAYSQSLQLQPTCVAYANRAMAQLKLRQYEQADADCTAAIALDASYLKAWQRRCVVCPCWLC